MKEEENGAEEGKENKSDTKWERTNRVIDNLCRAAWKLQGVAGLMFIDDMGKTITLSDDQANGLSFLLEQLAEDILKSANLITEVKP